MSGQENLQLGEAKRVQEGEAGDGRRSVGCSTHARLLPVPCGHALCEDGSRGQLESCVLEIEVTELALGLKAEGCAALSGKISSLTSHITQPQVGAQGTCPYRRSRLQWSFSLLVPSKKQTYLWQTVPVRRAMVTKREQNLLPPRSEGKGTHLVSDAPRQAGGLLAFAG